MKKIQLKPEDYARYERRARRLRALYAARRLQSLGRWRLALLRALSGAGSRLRRAARPAAGRLPCGT
ncbi:hypothetical protein Q4485_11180 [Granulosicoccaceae sp. 1_MG-2023]|nr:hypothetical protein [Granulosicoccaceae sp. 1_MG-2023]